MGSDNTYQAVMSSPFDRIAGTAWKLCLGTGVVGVALLAASPPAVGTLSLVGFVGVLALGASLGGGSVVAYLYVDSRLDAKLPAEDAPATGEDAATQTGGDSSIPKAYDPRRIDDEDEGTAGSD